ncbi:MAG: hypothetical protein JNJ49_02420 [Bdellovibrionaceae bacterium]|nr:hypothetical protein [Pseudobdellovibrionaceae bacterium]
MNVKTEGLVSLKGFCLRWVAGGVASLALVATLGCQLNTQEAAEQSPMKLGGPTANCFAPSLQSVEKYFKSQASVEEVDSAFTCFSGALDMFVTYSRGSKQHDSYSTQELRTFLERHFLGDLRLSDPLLDEVMRVKQALLGGAADQITKTEIYRLIEVLETFRREAIRLRPYVSILNLSISKDDLSLDPALLEQAISDFAFSMDTLGSLLGQSKQVYRVENMKALLTEFQGLYRGRSTWKGPNWFSEKMQLIAATKALLIRPNGNDIAPDEWRLLFSHIGRIYGLFLRLQYALSGRDLFRGEGLNQLEISVIEVLDVLKEAMASKSNGKIDYTLINAVLDGLDTMNQIEPGVLPLQIKTIRDVIPVLLERVFNPIRQDDSRFAPPIDPNDPLTAKGSREEQGGLTPVNLGRMREALFAWIEMQRFWERLEVEAVRRDPQTAGRPLPMKQVREIWDTFQPVHHEAWADLKSLFDRPMPLSTRPNGSLQFLQSKDVVMDFESFKQMNWKQTLVRVLGYGYVADPKGLRMSGITLDQFEQVFKDFRAVAVDLKFLEPDDVTIWKTGFTIANIFLFSSNGDDRLGYHEAVDLFVFSFASSEIAKKIRVDVDANCTPLEPDSMGLPKIEAKCWRERVKTGYGSYFTDLPGWLKQAAKFSESSWKSFFGNLEKASRKVENPKGPLASTEMDRAISIHHYIESLFTRWDANRDGVLTRREANKAFFLFKKLLKEASGFDDDDDVLALYMYLLTYGEPPDKGRFSDIVRWLWWSSNPEVWETRVHANRARITQIFGALAAEL